MTPPPAIDTICVVGLGYIGLPTAAVFAQTGKLVIGVDLDESRVQQINAGALPFVEDGLGVVLAGVVAQGQLKAQGTTPSADAYIISVPTPFVRDHEADLSYIEEAARGIASKLRGGELVVLESTSPPGTTARVGDVILTERPDLTAEAGRANSVYLAHAPERVLPGRIMVEMVENDRIIGGTTPEAAALCIDLYASFCRGELVQTDARTAELAKLTENSFRDVNIAFANELSLIADRQDVDVWELIELANRHPRVNILQPGPGVGGHCIAVDPWFIVSAEREASKLIATARAVNDHKPESVIKKVMNQADKFQHPVVAALGIAFKPNIDDLRESPSKNIALTLADRMAEGTVLVVEPNIEALPPSFNSKPNVELVGLETGIDRADILLVLVDHDPFKTVEAERRAGKIVIDIKGLWR